jgi:hypothetical protein
MVEGYVGVRVVQGRFEEDQVRAFLEANGITTLVRGEALRSTHGLTLDGLGAVEILVPADREAEARDLLTKVEQGELELDP